MSKNKKTNKPNSTRSIRRLKSFDRLALRNNIITKQPFFSLNFNEQGELELSGDDKRPNPNYSELL